MPFDLQDIAAPLDAAAVLRLLPHRPRLLALGEPTHGEDVLLGVRNTLFRHLVEETDHRTIALETDCLAGLAVDAYVTCGTGTLDTAMAHGFSHGWGALAANRALVGWMRAYNVRAEAEGRPAADRLRFAGFDGPLEITHAASPRISLTALHAHLAAHLDPALLPCTAEELDALLGEDDRWSEPAAMTKPARSCGRSAEAVRLCLLADDLTALLDQQEPRLRAALPSGERETARLHARTATGLLRYHRAMADPSPARMSRLCAQRDLMMADNLLALAARGPVLAHAQNAHFQRPKSSTRMWQGPVEWWSAGALAGARLGEEYAFLATALGTLPHRGVGTPPPDTLEGLLYAGLPGDRHLLDASRLAAALGDPPPAPRRSPWPGYAPLDPAHLERLDGLVLVKDVPRS
ncbi:Erythromycin esterase OS=Streptomyces rutgersensis OX=53451 GN=F0345_23435 PE=4 SV=1 [Streptomyces diastaticus subsp. diastaticus]